MAVTVKRRRFAGTWFSDAEHAQVVQAARVADLPLSAFVRRASLREAARLAGRHVAAARELVEASHAS